MIDLTKRLRGTVPSIPAMRDAADEIEKLRACYATVTTELDRLRQEHAAQLAELAAISGALGTNEGHSSVTLIERLRAERDALVKEDEIKAAANKVLLDEIERLRAVLVAAKGLNAESEEYDFDYGLGRAAPNSYWEELDDAIEAIDAAKERR